MNNEILFYKIEVFSFIKIVQKKRYPTHLNAHFSSSSCTTFIVGMQNKLLTNLIKI